MPVASLQLVALLVRNCLMPDALRLRGCLDANALFHVTCNPGHPLLESQPFRTDKLVLGWGLLTAVTAPKRHGSIAERCLPSAPSTKGCAAVILMVRNPYEKLVEVIKIQLSAGKIVVEDVG